MARSRSELKQLLEKSLLQGQGSAIWYNLRQSLLGQELINLGASVLALSEAEFETFYRNLFPDTADMRGLIYLSNAYQVPFVEFNPAYLKVSLPYDSEAVGTVYAPFSIVAVAGSVKYTNISYVKASESLSDLTEVILYQGNVKCVDSNNAHLDLGFLNVSYETPLKYYVDSDANNQQQYVKLSKNALPSSVYVFDTDVVAPVAKYDAVSADPNILSYSLVKGYDQILDVMFGDNIMSKGLGSTNFAIYYLDCTFNLYADTPITLQIPGQLEIELDSVYILSRNNGEQDSVVLARQSLKAQLAKNSVLATADQIRSYVNSFPNIIDSHVVKGDDLNEVITYTKPVSQLDLSHDDIQEMLRLYGELVTTYKVQNGTPVSVRILLRSWQILSTDKQTQIKNFLVDALAYNKLPYKSNLSVSVLTAMCAAYSTTLLFSIVLSLGIKNMTMILLKMRPVVNTLQFMENALLKAWDYNGEVFGYLTTKVLKLQQAFKFGDFYIIESNENPDIVNVFDLSTGRFVEYSSSALPLYDALGTTLATRLQNRVLRRGDLLLYYYASESEGTAYTKYRIFDAGREFHDGEYSIMHSASVIVFPKYPETPSSFITAAAGVGNLCQNSIWLEQGILKVVQTNDSLQTQLYAPDSAYQSFAVMSIANVNLLSGASYDNTHTYNVVGFIPMSNGLGVIIADEDAGTTMGFVINTETWSSAVMDMSAIIAAIETFAGVGFEWVQVFAENSVNVLVTDTNGDFHIIHAASCSVTWGQNPQVVFDGSPIELVVPTLDAHELLTIIGDTSSNVTLGVVAEFVANYVRVVLTNRDTAIDCAVDTTSYPSLAKVGSVNYDQKTVQLSTAFTDDTATLSYETNSPMSELSDDSYIVVTSVDWDE